MEADFRSHGIPVGIREFDTHLASGKLDNADTAKFAGLLKKAGGLEKKGTDVSKFMEEFEKYSSDDHLLGKENFGRHLFDRSFGHYSAISTVSRIYKKRMDETKSADELIRQFQHWGRLSKFLGDDEAGAIRAANVEADRLKTFAVNVKRFALDGRQKALILSELRELENRLHAVYSRAAASLPMLLFDSIDAVAAGQTEETRGLDFFKMNPVIGAPFRNYALKSKLHGRGYIDLITRKINVRKDLCQLPEVSYLPEDRVCRGNMFVTLAMHDLSPYLDKKYRTIFLARCLAMIVSGEPQTDPFTGKRIVRKNGHSDPHDLDGFTVDGERNL